MAETFTGFFAQVAFAAAKNMAAILNSHATELLKIRRVGYLNDQTAAVTGVVCQLQPSLYVSGSPGLTSPTSITPTKHDSTNTLPASYTIGHAGTIAGTQEKLRSIFWSSDEPAVSTGSNDELENFVPLNIVVDAGYGDSNVQPYTLRQTQMFLNLNTTGAAGLLTTWMEFTRE